MNINQQFNILYDFVLNKQITKPVVFNTPERVNVMQWKMRYIDDSYNMTIVEIYLQENILGGIEINAINLQYNTYGVSCNIDELMKHDVYIIPMLVEKLFETH